jgi:hypothetical protein
MGTVPALPTTLMVTVVKPSERRRTTGFRCCPAACAALGLPVPGAVRRDDAEPDLRHPDLGFRQEGHRPVGYELTGRIVWTCWLLGFWVLVTVSAACAPTGSAP